MPNSKQIVYLSQSQYAELIANGSITVNGVTVTYDENDIYVTPQAEPVTDVRVNGTSIAASGVANIPAANNTVYGVVKVQPYNGLRQNTSGFLEIAEAEATEIKEGTPHFKPIVPCRQHNATFYGLATASGDTTQSSSSNAVGSYTPEAKGAIQSMLGVSDLIATAENSLVASKAYAVGDVFTANGKLYKATAAIAADAAIITDGANANCEETSVGDGFPHDVQVNGVSVVSDGVAEIPLAKLNTLGVLRAQTDRGINYMTDGVIQISNANGVVKPGTNMWRPIVPMIQHESTFYGLAKAAGDATQSASDNAVGTYTDEAKAAIRTMVGAVGNEDYATSSTGGTVKVNASYGLDINSGNIRIKTATFNECKNQTGSTGYQPITVYNQHYASFYGLATAAGDTTQKSSSNAVGTYTDNAKASIKSMLGIVDGSTGTVDVTGTTPTITAVENTRYVCGEVTSLSFTPPASGISIVRFTSGSTVTVLTLPSTVKFPEWFDPTTLETNTIYEICITDGIYGAVMSWAQ